MALDIGNPTHEHRPYGFVIVGLFLLGLAGIFGYDAAQRRPEDVVTATTYRYRINQESVPSVTYFKNSFFGETPGAGNTAYVAELTDQLKGNFSYRLQSEQEAELTTTHFVKAVVRAKYVIGSDGKDVSDVWSKEYPIVKPVTDTKTTKSVAIKESVSVPYSEYRKTVEQLRGALSLPVSTEMVITFSVQVRGVIDGAQINDTKITTLTTPLDQPLFKIANTFQKEDIKQVSSQSAKQGEDSLRRNETILAVVLAGLGALAVV